MQTEVTANLPQGIAGQPADQWTARNADIVTAHSEEASAEIRFGIMLVEGTAEDGAKLCSAQSDLGKFRGISVHNHYFNYPTQIGDTGVKPGMSLGAARTGRWYVPIETDVTKASEVHVRVVATGDEVAGSFRASKDDADTIDLTAFAKWFADADSDDGLGILEINLPIQALAVADS